VGGGWWGWLIREGVGIAKAKNFYENYIVFCFPSKALPPSLKTVVAAASSSASLFILVNVQGQS